MALALAIFGLLMLFVIIPAQTEAVDYGWLRPDTLPVVTCWVVTACGLWQATLTPAQVRPRARVVARLLLYLIVAFSAVWAMTRLGFLVLAPILVLLLNLLAGERRVAWLAAQTVCVPLVIWLLVDVLLGRPLP